MRRIIITCLTLIAAALLVVPATAGAQKRARRPCPDDHARPADAGGRGRNAHDLGPPFQGSASQEHSDLPRQRRPHRFRQAAPRHASSKLVVRVPALGRTPADGGQQQPEAHAAELSVLAGKFSKFTPRRLSPVVTGFGDGSGGGPGGAGAGAVCNGDSDYDNDLLSNSRELEISTTRASRTPTATRSRTARSTSRPWT